jgi:two-component system response regulator AtoC
VDDSTIRLLIAEDDQNLRKVLGIELAAEGFQVTEAAGGAQALSQLQKEEYDVLLLDLNMPDLSGMELLLKIGELELPTEVVILTADATVSSAVEAMRRGACDYLTKPIQVNELVVVLQKAFEKKNLIHELHLLRSQIHRQDEFPGLVTRSPIMLELLRNVRAVAQSSVAVHIFGESGVGKELIARGIHASSDRSAQSFIAINCSALTESVFESELFGHEKGAFTGAVAQKPGLLEMAHRGTFFIDEVGEMPLQLQAKLLRALETGTFYRVGGVREVHVDARIVSASNRDLRRESNNGGFRKDLFWRISTISLFVPPLRERKQDIPLLVEHFLAHLPSAKPRRIGKAALQMLMEYGWPGNVRELQNVLQRATLLTSGEVLEPADFGGLRQAGDAPPAGKRLDEVEKAHILAILQETGGHRGRTADILGIDPKTLYRKLRQYEIPE